MQNFGNIIYKTDTKAYIIKDGTYTVPHPGDTSVPVQLHEEFDALYAEIDKYAKLNPNKVTEEKPHVLTFDELKAIKLSEINSKYSEATSSLVSTYPSTELLSFDKQEQEARAWLKDNNIETPLIDALAEGRQIDKTDLVNRIINKSELFAIQTGYLTGQRQHYEDQLELATTEEEIKAIIPKYKYYKIGEVNANT